MYESMGPPTPFLPFGENNEDVGEDNKVNVTVEYCPLCLGTKRALYCMECIKKGNFTHSKKKPSNKRTETYQEKAKKLQKQLYNRDKLKKRIAEKLAQNESRKKKQLAIIETKRHLNVLQNGLEIATNKCDELEKAIKIYREKANITDRILAKHKVKYKEMVNNLKAHKESHDKTLKLKEIWEKVALERRERVQELVEYIFPITEEKVADISDEEDEEDPITAELRDARHATLIHGKWIHDSASENIYRVVDAPMPGICQSDIASLLANISVEKTPILKPKNSQSYGVAAAFTYLGQLIASLSAILDVPLPEGFANQSLSMAVALLSSSEPSSNLFIMAAICVNRCALLLASSQLVPSDSIRARHAVHNVIATLKSPDLGRIGHFEITERLVCSVDGQLIFDNIDMPNWLISETIDSEEDDADENWEQVPISLPDDGQLVLTRNPSESGAFAVMSSAVASLFTNVSTQTQTK
ncbi:DgyrCDS9471 [Dimorphilus gyrociliatus]|uniref:DgyrCDS9471 n=1 Tax=Dimorphilus gyrociliatus TaxID=2664684 RepID=A0A7I8VYR1_9ANNE|nr:DgyrCDS9471 [Dimorphilus gyrociliatus]